MKFSLLLLPSESLLFYLGLPIQALPLINFVAIIYFFKNNFTKTFISKILVYLYLYLIFITVIYMNIDLIIMNKDRVFFFMRQFISLTFGVSLFFFFRTLFLKYSDKTIFVFIIYSYYIVVIGVVFEILQGKFYRIQSIYTEPSHFGQYLIFVILPIILYLKIKKYISKSKFYLLIFSVLIFTLMTLSFTTILKLLLFLSFLLFFQTNNKLKFFFNILLLFIFFFTVFLIIKINYSDNYMFNMVSDIINKIQDGNTLSYMPISLIDRLNFWIALFHSKINLEFIFGYGIAGDYLYGNELVPNEIYEKISLVKAIGFNLGSFMGKIFAYGGIIAVLIVIFLFYKSINLKSNIYIDKAILSAIFIYLTIGMGVFSMIPLWFWLAYVDSKYILQRKTL